MGDSARQGRALEEGLRLRSKNDAEILTNGRFLDPIGHLEKRGRRPMIFFENMKIKTISDVKADKFIFIAPYFLISAAGRQGIYFFIEVAGRAGSFGCAAVAGWLWLGGCGSVAVAGWLWLGDWLGGCGWATGRLGD